VQANQAPEDRHGPGYDNRVNINSWLRNGDATSKPSFDFGNSWRTARHSGMADQIKDRPQDHNRHHSEFTLRHNAGETAEQQAWDPNKRHIPHWERKGERGIDNSDLPKHRGS
jgi:hypothetical protein